MMLFEWHGMYRLSWLAIHQGWMSSWYNTRRTLIVLINIQTHVEGFPSFKLRLEDYCFRLESNCQSNQWYTFSYHLRSLWLFFHVICFCDFGWYILCSVVLRLTSYDPIPVLCRGWNQLMYVDNDMRTYLEYFVLSILYCEEWWNIIYISYQGCQIFGY